MNTTQTPYSLFEGNTGGFLIAELPEMQVALPYFGLRQMKHHARPELIILQFAELNVEVHGRSLGQLFESLAIMRVRRIGVGTGDKGFKIDKIEVLEG
jgi:hypothetical protein